MVLDWLRACFSARSLTVSPPGPWPDGWEPVMGCDATRLDAALARSLPRGHILSAGGWHAIGRDMASDDALFGLHNGRVALVHMTWSRERDPDRPDTAVFDAFSEFTAWAAEEAAARQAATGPEPGPEPTGHPGEEAEGGPPAFDPWGVDGADPRAISDPGGEPSSCGDGPNPMAATASAACTACGADWRAGEAGRNCPICDGYALTRPCPICHGRCGAPWRRAIVDSNDAGEPVWIGACARAAKEGVPGTGSS